MKFFKQIAWLIVLTIIPTAAFAQDIGLSLPDTSGTEGDTLLYPVYVDSSMTDYGILSYELEFSFNDSDVEALGIETNGTLSSDFTVEVNTNTNDRLTVAGSGANALEGKGVLFYIQFHLKRDGYESIRFNGSSNNFYNEGEAFLLNEEGSVSIDPQPTISVSPRSRSPLTVGDEVNFSVSDGTPPYTWSLTNESVGSINSEGLFQAENHGQTKIIAEDSVGLIDTTDSFQIRAFKFLNKDTTIVQKQELLFPVLVSDLSGLGILSGSFEFEYRQDLLQFEGIETSGTILEGVEHNASENSDGIEVAFSSTNEINEQGTLMYLKFRADDESSGSANPSYRNIIFNEDLRGNSESQRININRLPDISVDLSDSEMLAGQNQQITANNTTGSVEWSVTDSTVAEISNDGVLTALKGGEVRATATDSIGASGTSSSIKIYDVVIDLADTTAFNQDTLLFPVFLENASEERGFISVEMEVVYNPDLMEILSVETSESLTDGWSFSLNETESNQVKIAGAGSGEIVSGGELFYLEVALKEASFNNQTANLTIENGSLLLNEGQPIAKSENGSTTITTTPFKVELNSPENDSADTPTLLNFSWQEARGADEYQLQIATDQSFNSTFKDTSGIIGTDTDISGLGHETQYYWRVRGSNDTGNGEWSDVHAFTTIVAPPSAPFLQSPFNGLSDADTSVTFQWDEVNKANEYRFQLSSDVQFDSLFHEEILTANNFQVHSLDFSTTYYWRVSGINQGGEGEWSEVFSFTTFDGLPSIVTLLQPQDGAAKVNLNPDLEWHAAELAEEYELQVSRTSDFSSFVLDTTSVADTTLSVSLEYGTEYHWQVRAVNAQGTSPDWSAPFSFTTMIAPPEVPALLEPQDGAQEMDTLANLRWSKTARADSFNVQLARNETFSDVVFETTSEDTTASIGGLDFTTGYFWRVKASNSTGQSEWSEVYSFTTKAPDASVPSLQSPPNQAEDLDTTLTFEWSQAEHAKSYQFQLSQVMNFSTTDEDSSDITQTVIEIENMAYFTTYYWRVRAIGEQDTSSWSSVFSFTTKVESPEKPTLLEPGDNAVETDTALVLVWTRAARADSFTVQLASDNAFSDIAFETTKEDTAAQVTELGYESEYFWRVQSSNSTGESDWSEVFSFTTKERENQPPTVANALGHVTLDEDFGETTAAVLDTVFSDPEGAPLSFEIVEYDTTLFTASLTADTLRLESLQDVNGDGSVILKATDEEGAEAEDMLQVEITPVNDLPEIVSIPDTLTFRNDEELTIQLDTSFTDVEDNLSDLTVEITVEPDDIIVAFNEEELTASLSAPDYTGEGTLNITVTDTDNGQAEAEIIVVVEMSTANELAGDIPEEYDLYQNYPNPFNPSTQIRFDLPQASEVNIEVYSMLGQKVATLANKRYKAGHHKLTFDAGSFSSGMYIYRIQAGDFIETKKMMLIK